MKTALQIDISFEQILDPVKNVNIQPKHFINRDPKDNFLLDLIDF